MLDKLPTSNNAVEGWHNAFNNSMGIALPTTENLLRELLLEQRNMLLLCRQLDLGQPPAKK